MALTCSNCQAQLPDEAAFCHRCGNPTGTAQIKEPRFCEKCGVLLRDDAVFCLSCGTPAATDRSHWMEKRNQAREDEIRKERQSHKVTNFEEVKHNVLLRAYKWAEYAESLMSAPECFSMLATLPISAPISFFSGIDTVFFRTNKPNAHKALIRRTMIDVLLSRARQRGYIDDKGNCSPTVITYIKLMRNEIGPAEPSDWLQNFRLQVDYSQLDELAKKDDVLFPPPEQKRVKVAGAILNFSTDEGVLIVYMDSSHTGKSVAIDFADVYISSAYGTDRRQTKVLERSLDGTTTCAAIFNNIPFVTDNHRYHEEVLRQLEVTLEFFPSDRGWIEKVIVFRGKVTELDWRGRKT